MYRGVCRLRAMILLAAALAGGCSSRGTAPSPSTGAAPAAEEQVRGAFAELQEAFKARDADKVWGLLSRKSRDDAEQVAGDIRTAYGRGRPEEKSEQEKALGLTGAELATLTGAGFLKSKPFLRKYDEVTEGKLDRVTVAADSATVYWDDDEGDKEKTVFVREDGRWKAWLAIPKAK
jgi:hypothetical protein